jgi:hypothetical protein
VVAGTSAQVSAQTAVVKVTEDEAAFTLSNGIITARILKTNGDIRSLQYKGTEILTDKSGHAGGYWSHDTTGGKSIVTKVVIDPSANAASVRRCRSKGSPAASRWDMAQGRRQTAISPPILKSATRWGAVIRHLHVLHLRASARISRSDDDRGRYARSSLTFSTG